MMVEEWLVVLADRTLSNGRHLVLGDHDASHRIWIRDTAPRQPLAYVIARDKWIEQRWNAARRLDRRLAGAAPLRLPSGIQPTGFQRYRLSMLLDILDDVMAPGGTRISTHEIALRHVYPGMTIGRGTQWKASSERRRTQRLIEEALGLMRGGYRALLTGLSTGATKVKGPK